MKLLPIQKNDWKDTFAIKRLLDYITQWSYDTSRSEMKSVWNEFRLKKNKQV